MDYVVTAELQPPVDAADLDALQQEGVAALLERQLSQVEGVANEHGRDIDMLDYRVTTRANGVAVLLALDAPSLGAAESSATTVLDELLAQTPLLTGWEVAHSEVRITEDEFNQSLAAAESGAEAELEAAVEEALGGALPDTEPTLDTEQWRQKLTDLAVQFRAFEPEIFVPDKDSAIAGQAELVGGALIHAVRVVTDELFYDELALAVNNATVHEAVGLLVLEELPVCYEDRYDATFARAMLLCSSSVAAALTTPDWVPPRCVAEAFALHLMVNEARVLLEAAELLSWEQSGEVFAAFEQRAFRTLDHEELFDIEVPLAEDAPDPDGVAARIDKELRARGLAFDQWFRYRDEPGVHPFLRAYE